MAEVLVVGKKISEMDLVTDIVGDEKIPTGVVGDKAVTTGQLLTYLDSNGKVQWGRIEGDIANQVDLQNQFSQERDTLKSYTQEQVYQQQVALQEHIDVTNESFKYARDNGSALPYQEGISYVEGAVVVKEGVLQQRKGVAWRSAVAESLSDTVQTFVSPEAGVDPVTGVTEGAYFNVLSSSEGAYADEYQNVGGVATPTGKWYLSALGVEQQEKSAGTIKDASGKWQQEINDLLLKAKDEYVNIFDFCKCDGTDESAEALLAVNRANSRRIPLYIPPNAELLINGTTTLEPIYGIFGGGRIRKGLYGWLSGSPAILINNPNQFVDNIRFVKSDTAWVDLESVTVTNNTDRVGWIEVTKNAKNFKITNNIFRGGRFCNWIYGGTNGLVFGNDSDATEEAFIYFGTTNVYTKPLEVIGVVNGVVVANNRVRNVSNASLGGSTGDGIKTTMRCKNIAIIGNNIQGCRGDGVDLFASGESILISNNIIANNTVKGVDIKSASDLSTEWPKDIVKQQQITVTGNHIYGNGQFGVGVAFNGGIVSMVNISGNNIYKNAYGGINYQGENGIISNNFVYANATYAQSYASGIRIEGNFATDTYSRNVKCFGNICVNNGNSTNTDNCGIVVFSGRVEDCDIHSNILINSDLPGMENSGMQNYGFFSSGGKRISFLHNTANGNITGDVGWSLGSELIGTTRTVNLGTVSDNTEYPLGPSKKNWGVHSIEVQSKTYVADSTNYFTLSIRKVDSAGVRTAISNFLSTGTESLGIYPLKKTIATNRNEKDAVPFLLPIVTGTPTPIDQLTVSLNIIEW